MGGGQQEAVSLCVSSDNDDSKQLDNIYTHQTRVPHAVFPGCCHCVHGSTQPFKNLVLCGEKTQASVLCACMCSPASVTVEPTSMYQIKGAEGVTAIITFLAASWKWATEYKVPINACAKGRWRCELSCQRVCKNLQGRKT